MPDNKTCFVICPIGDSGTPIRKRSDQVLKHIIEPAAKECGFDALRSDHISATGIITSQVIQHILEDPMVVADLTGSNANVFYELAIRHAIRRPYVQIIDENEPLPFDVAGIRTIPFTHLDLDSAETARKEIVKHILAMADQDTYVESPITVSVDLSSLKRSENSEDRHLGDVLTALSELKEQFSLLKHLVAASSPYILRRDSGVIGPGLAGGTINDDGSISFPKPSPNVNVSAGSGMPIIVGTGMPLVTRQGSVTVVSDVRKRIVGDSIPKEP
jgi:hypothetical protein